MLYIFLFNIIVNQSGGSPDPQRWPEAECGDLRAEPVPHPLHHGGGGGGARGVRTSGPGAQVPYRGAVPTQARDQEEDTATHEHR